MRTVLRHARSTPPPVSSCRPAPGPIVCVRRCSRRVGPIARASAHCGIHVDPAVDLADVASIPALFSAVGPLDAVVVAAGGVPFKPVTELTREDYADAFAVKTIGQLDVVRHAFEHLSDGGSVTLTSGVLSREPIATAAAAAAANGAIESFVTTAALEAPRGIRLNVVSPDVLENSPHHHATFPGHRPVTDAEVARAFVRAVEGIVTGRTLTV